MRYLAGIFIIAAVCACGGKSKLSSPGLPSCIDSMITAAKGNDGNGPQSVTRYIFEGKKVFYVVSPCCDQYNVLYDENCRVIGYPDGSITGRGDGRVPDFENGKSNEKLIWKK